MSYTPTASLDSFSSAASYVSRNWGDHGYSIGLEASSFGSGIYLVRHSDGSEFRILVDRWGNASRPAQCDRGTIGCEVTDLCHSCP